MIEGTSLFLILYTLPYAITPQPLDLYAQQSTLSDPTESDTWKGELKGAFRLRHTIMGQLGGILEGDFKFSIDSKNDVIGEGEMTFTQDLGYSKMYYLGRAITMENCHLSDGKGKILIAGKYNEQTQNVTLDFAESYLTDVIGGDCGTGGHIKFSSGGLACASSFDALKAGPESLAEMGQCLLKTGPQLALKMNGASLNMTLEDGGKFRRDFNGTIDWKHVFGFLQKLWPESGAGISGFNLPAVPTQALPSLHIDKPSYIQITIHGETRQEVHDYFP